MRLQVGCLQRGRKVWFASFTHKLNRQQKKDRSPRAANRDTVYSLRSEKERVRRRALFMHIRNKNVTTLRVHHGLALPPLPGLILSVVLREVWPQSTMDGGGRGKGPTSGREGTGVCGGESRAWPDLTPQLCPKWKKPPPEFAAEENPRTRGPMQTPCSQLPHPPG